MDGLNQTAAPVGVQLSMEQLILRKELANAQVLPLTLSSNTSINLSAVTAYGMKELLDDDDKPTGKFEPVISLTGGDDVVLTDEENDIFRPIWAKYANNSNLLFSMLDFLDAQT